MITLVSRVDTYMVADEPVSERHLHPSIRPSKVKVTIGQPDNGWSPESVAIHGVMLDGETDNMPGRDRAHHWGADDINASPEFARQAVMTSLARARGELRK
jgi:hypothetical protein